MKYDIKKHTGVALFDFYIEEECKPHFSKDGKRLVYYTQAFPDCYIIKSYGRTKIYYLEGTALRETIEALNYLNVHIPEDELFISEDCFLLKDVYIIPKQYRNEIQNASSLKKYMRTKVTVCIGNNSVVHKYVAKQ